AVARAVPAALSPLAVPGRQQRLGNARRDRLLVGRKLELDREPPLLDRVGLGEAADGRLDAERRELRPIGVGGEAKAARRRQPGARERREARRLRADADGVGGGDRVEREDE